MEKLFEIHAEDRYDLLVLDTPPSRNALDFLEAPQPPDPVHRGPGAAGVPEADRVRDAGLRPRHVDGVLGAEADHRRRPAPGPLRVLPGVQRHGRRLPRARQAGQRAARRRPRPRFLVVCGPQGEPISEAVYFHRKLVEAELPFGGVIVNKVHYEAERRRARRRARAGAAAGARRRRPRRAGRRQLRRLPGARRARPAQRRAPRRARCARGAVIEVPYLDDDVHDLAGLMEINRYLFASRRQGARRSRPGRVRASRPTADRRKPPRSTRWLGLLFLG